MPKGRSSKGKFVKHMIEIIQQSNCYIYKRPHSAVCQCYLQMDSVETRKSTGIQGDNDDISFGRQEAYKVAEKIYLTAISRKDAGHKPIVKKKLFDMMYVKNNSH